MLQLTVVEPQGNVWRLSLEAKEYIIGRNPSLAIALKDRKVSRRHARLYLRDSTYWIEDLGSSNGVSVDGTKIKNAVRLGPGARVEISGFRLTFQETAGNE